MIEVEKKFSLTKEQQEKIKSKAEFIGKKDVIDIYWDNDEYDLTKNDIWLRERNKNFELKVCKNRDLNRVADQYDEIEEENKIREFLKIEVNKTFTEDLKNAGYKPIINLKTERSKYKRGQFTIDIDEVTSEGFYYNLVEIELMAKDEKETQKVTQEIINFAESLGLKTDKITLGKVIEFLRQKRPDHFDLLVETGVVNKEFKRK